MSAIGAGPMVRFLSKCIPHGDSMCWTWIGGRETGRYGRFNMNGASMNAQRAAYILFIGPIPRNAHICHTCDNRLCVNPKHLYAGSNETNVKDRVARGRTARGELAGNAKLTEQDILSIYRDTRTRAAVARAYGVTPSVIERVASGKTWRHVADRAGHQCSSRNTSGVWNGRAKLTPDSVRDIRASHASARDLAVKYGVSESSIFRVRRAESWRLI